MNYSSYFYSHSKFFTSPTCLSLLPYSFIPVFEELLRQIPKASRISYIFIFYCNSIILLQMFNLFVEFLENFVIFSYLIPISLYVTVGNEEHLPLNTPNSFLAVSTTSPFPSFFISQLTLSNFSVDYFILSSDVRVTFVDHLLMQVLNQNFMLFLDFISPLLINLNLPQ